MKRILVRRYASAISAAILVALVLAASAEASVYTARWGSVRATLTDRSRTGGGLTVRIDRAGVVFVYGGLYRACGGFGGCPPVADPYGAPVVSVRPAAGRAEPDVFVHLSNGGNICCRSTFIYHYHPGSGGYTSSVHVWGDAADSGAPRSLGHNRQVFFVSEDGRFRYRFGCGACTPGPIQIWRDVQGRLVDVTRSFRRLIWKDARRWRRLYFKERANTYGADGVLVAYVADEELLGHGGSVWRFVHQQGRAGYLTEPGSGFTRPENFYNRLHHFLSRLGYIGGRQA